RVLPRHDPTLTMAAGSGQLSNELHAIRRTHTGARVWFNLYFGERLSLENTYSVGTSDIGYQFTPSTGGAAHVTGTLAMKQLTGGVRYDAFRQGNGSLRLYGRAGY